MGVRWPLISNTIRRHSESHTFGMVRKHPDGTPKPHQGWDFYAPVGTGCYAIEAGEVVFSGDIGAFGLIIVHSFQFSGTTYYAAYAHMQQSMARKGDKVSKGQKIGLTGRSGNASNLPALDMHLHFEIRTIPLPGLGLSGRISPLKIFGICPLKHTITCPLELPAKFNVFGQGTMTA